MCRPCSIGFEAGTCVRPYVYVAIAPHGIAAHAGDAELSCEFQMFGELIAIHDQVRLTAFAKATACHAVARKNKASGGGSRTPRTKKNISCGVRL